MKGSSSMQEEMNQEEMQRFLNREAERGSSEYEALKALAYILNINFPKIKNNAKQ
jgi:hypothetical protein